MVFKWCLKANFYLLFSPKCIQFVFDILQSLFLSSITTLEQIIIIYFSSFYNKIFSYFLNFWCFSFILDSSIIISLLLIIKIYFLNFSVLYYEHLLVSFRKRANHLRRKEREMSKKFHPFFSSLSIFQIWWKFSELKLFSVECRNRFLPVNMNFETAHDALNQNILMRWTKSLCQSPLDHFHIAEPKEDLKWKVLTSTQ